MKKLISIMLLLAMVLGLFAGCGEEKKETNTGLQSAVEYLTGMYQTAGKDEAILITADQDVLSSVVVEGVSYSVTWTVEVTEGAADSVTVAESTKENHVKLDIPLHSGSDILFTATATVADADGNSQTATFNYKVAGVKLAGEGMTMEELVEAAYALDEDEVMEGLAVLTGVVTMINTPYDDGYKNLTCTIVVGDLTDRPIKCYRLKGEGAENLAVGDTITVSGTLKNYGGTIEFDAGCMIDELIKNTEPVPEAPTDPIAIVEAAYALEENASLPYTANLIGTIISVDNLYDPGYQNITVTIAVTGCEDKPIKCYRLKGDGADRLGVGDVISVTGVLMNYNGTVEFAQGCALTAIISGGEGGAVAPTDPLQIVDEAYALEKDKTLPYIATLTGVVKSLDTPYDATYQNVTVTMTVTGREKKPIKCYRMKGNGVETLAVGDTITVTGTIKNYGGTIEFDAGCILSAVIKGGNVNVTKPATEAEIVDQAYRLQRDQILPYVATLTGKVSAVKDAYNSQYKNITVVIKVPGRENLPITCYRMKGTDVDKVAVGDTVTVTGTIKNYNGQIQFDTGCNMDKRVSGGGTAIKPETDPVKIIDMAFGLKKNEEMPYDVTLSGKVCQIEDAYSAQHKNITLMIQVKGRESKPLLIYRLKGDGVDKIAVNDTITVAGRIKNYEGKVELANGTMTNRVSGGGTVIKQETDPAKIMAAAKQLPENNEMTYDVTLSGKVVSFEEAYNSEYKNVSVIISVSGTSDQLLLYRMTGTDVEKLAVGDTITAVGRIKNHYGTIEMAFGEMTKRTSGGGKPPVAQTDYTKIVDEAYALAAGASLAYTATLEGKIVELQSPYDAQYKNMTVVIAVAGRESKPIMCYRMKGDNIGNHLCVGDTITVEGKIKNYNGTIEFDSGCQMTNRKAGSVSKPTDPKKIVDAAFALGKNEVLPYFATLTGTVKAITEAYTEQYNNVTLTITVEGTNGPKDIVCYRMKGENADTVAVGNTITVTGAIKNYVGTDKDTGAEKPAVVEFDSGCVLESLQKSSSLYINPQPQVSENEQSLDAIQPLSAETNAAKILTEAYALADGEKLSYDATLTGKLTTIETPCSPTYKNISVVLTVDGYTDKPILCYRLKGDDTDKLAVGDTITVTGQIKNYKGTIEFDQGCTLDSRVSGGGVAPIAPADPKQVVDEAYALASGKKLPYMALLTGEITEIVTEYNTQYKNITVAIKVEGTSGEKVMQCYRLKGTGADTLKVGDIIVVEGIIQRYIKTDAETGAVTIDKVEFNAPSLIEVNPPIEEEPESTSTMVMCHAPDEWPICYVYTWDDSQTQYTGVWPGTSMKRTDGGLWYYEIPAGAKYVVFNNGNGGNGNQTKDLDVPTDDKNLYVIASDTWSKLPVEEEDDIPTTPAEIVAAAYALKDGESLDGTYTLEGKIVSVDYAYSASSQDITVTMEISGCEGKPIKCYRLKGTGVDAIDVKDTITVTGVLKNYKGTIEFDAGCTLIKYVKSEEPVPEAPSDPKQIVDEAFKLEVGASLPYKATLTGKIVSVDYAYSEESGDMTVTIEVEGTAGKKSIKCFRLTGNGIADLKEGDEITVTGTIKNYNGTVEFDRGVLTNGTSGDENPDDDKDEDKDDDKDNGGSQTNKTPAQIVAEAYALKNGESLPYEATLTGKITKIDYAYNATNGDITVTMTVEGKNIQCYRMTGTGIDKIKVGDTITVKGKIKNYNGTVEFDKGVLVSVNTGDSAPKTADISLAGVIIIMAMAMGATVLVVASKKKFYC